VTAIEAPPSLLSLRNRGSQRSEADKLGQHFPMSAGINGTSKHLWSGPNQTHDIFEGTEQIQQLVISRAISGLRIE